MSWTSWKHGRRDVTDLSEAARWASLDLDHMTFSDDLRQFDLSTLPPPGAAVVPLIVDVDPELAASLEDAAHDEGVPVAEIIRRRLRGAA